MMLRRGVELRRRSSSRRVFEIEVAELLLTGVFHDEGVAEFFNRPRWREATRGGHGRSVEIIYYNQRPLVRFRSLLGVVATPQRKSFLVLAMPPSIAQRMVTSRLPTLSVRRRARRTTPAKNGRLRWTRPSNERNLTSGL